MKSKKVYVRSQNRVERLVKNASKKRDTYHYFYVYAFLEGVQRYIRENYDITPRGIIEGLHLPDVDYNAVAAYGHFDRKGLPWEK